jgi:uncharacterized protein YecE (DUF72 family)
MATRSKRSMGQASLFDAPMPDPLAELEADSSAVVPPQLDLFASLADDQADQADEGVTQLLWAAPHPPATLPAEPAPKAEPTLDPEATAPLRPIVEPPPRTVSGAMTELFTLAPPLPIRSAPRTAARAAAVGPAPIRDEERALAAAIPASIRLGTSSWSFPGWNGLVYDGAYTEERLAKEGLAAYAQRPLFRTVALDRGYYAPVPEAAHRDYAAAVPDDFSFVMKGYEDLLFANFPLHTRYGARGGKPNPNFLNAEVATRDVVLPAMQGLGDKLGPILFQFPPQNVLAMGGVKKTLLKLRDFLGALPQGPTYAVEFRNQDFLTPDLGAVLRETGALPCLSVHPNLPKIGLQARAVGALDFPALLCRWLLRAGLSYGAAVERYAPFSAIRDDDPETRTSVAQAAFKFYEQGKPAHIIVNNKAEGSSPVSVEQLAARIAELVREHGQTP